MTNVISWISSNAITISNGKIQSLNRMSKINIGIFVSQIDAIRALIALTLHTHVGLWQAKYQCTLPKNE